MTKQEQIEEMAKIIDEMYNVYTTTADDIAEGIYNAGYRKIDDFEECGKCPAWSGTDCTRNPYTEGCLDDKVNLKNEIKRLEKENEQLKAKLEKNPMAIKQKIMEEDDYELTEREQATLFLDRMGSDVEILHDIVENLDELLGKGIDEYIKGIDGVEGLKDMWERSAVMEFAKKVKEEVYPFLQAEMYNKKHFITGDSVSDKLLENQNIGILKAQDVLSKWFKVKIDELLKEYE